MAWIILEGLDRTGKSSVAELYKKKGFEVVHFKAPDKKYFEPGYTGPSYLDDVLEMYMEYDNKDVVFDRSIYGEFVWPFVYSREAALDPEDMDVLREYEDTNNAQRILMIDPDQEAHWQRCVANNEPLNGHQFRLANQLFTKMAHKYGFMPKQLGDFDGLAASARQNDSSSEERAPVEKRESHTDMVNQPVHSASADSQISEEISEESLEQKKLEQANAINSILSKRIVKQKGHIFDKIERDIKDYLRKQLGAILGSTTNDDLTNEEIQMLKIFCQRLKDKHNNRG